MFFGLKTKYFLIVIFGCLPFGLLAQSLSLSDFLRQVLDQHPIVKQGLLQNNLADAKLLKARGGLDPKIQFQKQDKLFGGKEYFRQNTAQLKIPTGIGLELKAFYDRNTGTFLNPADKTPKRGLYGAGVALPLAKGLLNNERLTLIRKSKLLQKQTLALQQIAVNAVLYDAIVAYVNWLLGVRRVAVQKKALANARLRLQNVRINFKQGDKSAVDTLEAFVFYNNQHLAHQKAILEKNTVQIHLNNFLWAQENTPLQMEQGVNPDKNTVLKINDLLGINALDWSKIVASHPKIQSLNLKYQMKNLERRLARNELLPQVDLQYNWLSPRENQFPVFDNQQYKFGVQMSFPLFLRKSRGALKMAKIKMQDLSLERIHTETALKNKATVLQTTLQAYQNQLRIAKETAIAYEKLTKAEERKMALGDSNLFTVNYRAAKSIEAALKWIDIENKLLKTYAKVFKLKADSTLN